MLRHVHYDVANHCSYPDKFHVTETSSGNQVENHVPSRLRSEKKSSISKLATRMNFVKWFTLRTSNNELRQ